MPLLFVFCSTGGRAPWWAVTDNPRTGPMTQAMTSPTAPTTISAIELNKDVQRAAMPHPDGNKRVTDRTEGFGSGARQ